jgi:GT2 family glycosyltransferase
MSAEELARQGVSVITPCRNNPEEMTRFLKAISASRAIADEPVEVIVVDDSGPEAGVRISDACRIHGATYIRGPRNVGEKRNRGAERARYDLLLFVDSDCLATPSLIAEHLHAHRRPPCQSVGAVAGATLIVDTDDVASKVVRHAKNANVPFGWAKFYRQLGWAPTANLSISTTAFRSIDGFDERTFTVNGGEDVDLGVRLTMAGWIIVGNANAEVRHGTQSESVPSLIKKANRYGRADVYLRTRHPQRAEFYLNPATAALVVGLLGGGAAASGRWWLRAGMWAAVWVAAAMSLPVSPVVSQPPCVHNLSVKILAKLVDFAFDVGALTEAIRRRRPSMALGRFIYYRREEFVSRVSSNNGVPTNNRA